MADFDQAKLVSVAAHSRKYWMENQNGKKYQTHKLWYISVRGQTSKWVTGFS